MATHETSPFPSLHRLRLRASNCFLLIGEGLILVDSGMRGEGRTVLAAMERMGLRPTDLKLILLTHGHIDHAGAASRIATITGAPIALHTEDARWVRLGQEVPAPPITWLARAISRLLSAGFIRKRIALPHFTPDIELGDGETALVTYGIPGTVIHTPGHTAGSVSVLLEDGRAIVGDLVMNGFPSLKLKPAQPIVAQNLSHLARSWQVICERGARTVYPGHGPPFLSTSLHIRY